MPFETCWVHDGHPSGKSLCTFFFCLEWFSGTWCYFFCFFELLKLHLYDGLVMIFYDYHLSSRWDHLVLKVGHSRKTNKGSWRIWSHRGSVNYLSFEDSPALPLFLYVRKTEAGFNPTPPPSERPFTPGVVTCPDRSDPMKACAREIRRFWLAVM